MFHAGFMSAPGESKPWVPMFVGGSVVGLLAGYYGREFWNFLGDLFSWFKSW